MAEKKTKSAEKAPKPIGEVTHYYDKAGVAVVKFSKNVARGTEVHFIGAHTDFTDTLSSMQFDHAPVEKAEKGKEVGVKVSQKVHEGDRVYEA